MDTHRNVIELPLRSPHFEYVQCGSKTVDARIRFAKYRGLQTGDVLKFVKSRQKFILKKLTSIEVYDNFGHLLRTEGVRSCLPGLQDGDVKAGIELYHKFKARGESYADLAIKHKVLALRLGDVDRTPHQPVTRTNVTDLAKVLIPPSTRSQILTMTLHGEKPTQVIPPTPQPTTVTRHVPQPTPLIFPTVQPTLVSPTPPRIPQPTPETLPAQRDPSTTSNVVTPQPIQVSPPPTVITTLTTPDALVWKAADLVHSKEWKYKRACIKYKINLDPTGKYLGSTGDDYRRLKTAVEVLRRQATKVRMIQKSQEAEEQVGLHHKFLTFSYKYIYTQMNELIQRVSKAEQQKEMEKSRLRFLIENHENLKVELRNTEKKLARVTEERDEARNTIIHLREHIKTLSHILSSQNVRLKDMTIQRNEGTTQKRMRLSDR